MTTSQEKPSARDFRVETRTGSVGALLDKLESGAITFTPYPNFAVEEWNIKEQSRLVESLLLSIPIGAFCFDGTNDETWSVVDGLQRLAAIRRYVIDRDFELSGLDVLADYTGKRYPELPRHLQRLICEAEVTYYLIMPGTSEAAKSVVYRRIRGCVCFE